MRQVTYMQQLQDDDGAVVLDQPVQLPGRGFRRRLADPRYGWTIVAVLAVTETVSCGLWGAQSRFMRRSCIRG
jgi:hypothetical protein